jgi:DnaK suppressor protein
MDPEQARERLSSERAEVEALLKGTEQSAEEDRSAEAEVGDQVDAAQPLTAEGMDASIADTLRDRIAAIDRALRRIENGTYGLSVRSGAPIPDGRLEADPAAELTVDEAAAEDRG